MQAVFNYLTAHSESDDYSPLLVAPLTLAEQSIQMIRREAEHARKGRPARIIAKMNSLLEKSIVEALYEASQAGVEIDLNRARHLLIAARSERTQRAYTSALRGRAVPGTQPDLLLCQRRRGGRLLR